MCKGSSPHIKNTAKEKFIVKNLFNKSKLSLVVAMVASSVVLVGCEGDSKTTSVTQDSSRIEVTEVVSLKAFVRGIVQDTNGNPVASALVSIGGITARTDSTGAYVLSNVPVSGVADNSGNVLTATALQVSVKSDTRKYLSATVQVTPSASTIITEATSDDANDQNENTEDTLLSVIIFDGMSISAGTTVVPAIGSTVTGVLRDASTGLVIPSTVVALELMGVNGISQQQVQNTTSPFTSYGAMNYEVATDANGMFMFEDLPEDSDFDIVVEGYQSGVSIGGTNGGNLGITSIGGSLFATTPEVAIQNIGDIDATPISSNDDVFPFVTSVNGVVSQTTSPGVLNDDLDGTQGIVINFNEPLAAEVDANSVYMVDQTLNELIDVASATLSADGLTLTVTTTSAIPAGSVFTIDLNIADFEDAAQNNITTGPGTFMGLSTPSFDSNTNAGGIGIHRLTLQTYREPVIASGAITVAQIFEDTSDTEHPILRAISDVFIDVDADDTGIQQLNSTDNDDGGNDDTADRLRDLAAQTVSDSGIGTNPAIVEVDNARFSFNVTTSTTYLVTLVDSDGDTKNVNLENISNNVSDSGNGSQELELELDNDFSGASVVLVLDGIDPGDVVTVTPLTDFDTRISASAGSTTLVDQVAAIPVLQNSYGQGIATSGVANDTYGDGGELSALDSRTMGAPFLNITPRLLVPQAGNGVALPITSIWDTLTAGNVTDINDDDQIDVTSNMAGAYTGYDAAAIAAWTVGSRSIGVAFSEDIAVTGTPAFGGTATLSAFTAQNDVIQNDQGNFVNADLVNITVNDVQVLANTDDGQGIDFDGAIQDSHGNTTAAADGSVVVVRDLMPPKMLTAFYNGDTITLSYDEMVSLEANDDNTPLTLPNAADTFTLRGTGLTQTITVNQANEDANQSNASVTLDLTDLNQVIGSSPDTTTTVTEINKATLFNRGTYDHDNNSGTADRAHSIITGDRVRDDNNGTSWANWDNFGASVSVPTIVIQDTTGAFTSTTPTTTGFTNTSSSFVATYVFSHRIDLQASGLTVTDGADQLSGAEVLAGFTLTSGTTIDAGTSSANLSADGKTLVVTIGTAGAIASADTFVPANSFDSAWDSSAVDVAASLISVP
jgi:hypothetical protein